MRWNITVCKNMFGKKYYSLGKRSVLYRSFSLWKETTANVKPDLNFRVHLLLPFADEKREESSNDSPPNKPLVSGRNPRPLGWFCESRDDTPRVSSCERAAAAPEEKPETTLCLEINPKPERHNEDSHFWQSPREGKPMAVCPAPL